MPYRERLVQGEQRKILALLLGAVFFVLAIACVNVTNLLLAREGDRRHTSAIRIALGGDRRSLVRQSMSENALLALCGAVGGVLLSAWAFDYLKKADPRGWEAWLHLELGLETLGLGVLIALLAAFTFGLVPALRASHPALGSALGAGRRDTDGPAAHRLQHALVVAQIALALTLLVGAGNLLGKRVSLFTADRTLLIAIAVVWLAASPVGAIALKRRSLPVQEIFFGFFAGGLAALEAVVKGVSQAGEIQNTLLPTDPVGWWLFGASFLGAAGAFGMIQWSYLRSCRASVMGAVYNVAYVALPLLLTALLVDGSRLGPWSIVGLCVLTVGIAVLGTGSVPRGAEPET